MIQIKERCCRLKDCVLSIISYITVEPIAFVFFFCSYLNFMVFQNFLHYKICYFEYGYNEKKCNNLTGDEFTYVQTEMSKWQLYSNLALYIPSVLLQFFVGSWSDRFGFKMPMILPCVGAILYSLCLIINVVLMDLPLGVIILGDLINGLCGGFIAVLSSIYGFVSNVSLTTKRIGRIGFLEASTFIGGTVGQLISGDLIRSMGYSYVFVFTLFLNAILVFYILFFIKDIQPVPTTDLSGQSTCSRIFGGYHIRESAKICFRPRQGNRRLYIILILISFFCIFTVLAGENNITILYLKHDSFKWDSVKYGRFRGIKFGLGSFTLLIMLQFFHHWLLWQDTTFALIGALSKMAGYIAIGVIRTDMLMLILVPLISSCSSFTSPSLRSLISKLVEVDEKGKIFAIVSILEGFCNIVASLIFQNIYPLTSFFPGLCFEIFAAIMLVPIAIICWLVQDMKKESPFHSLVTETEDSQPEGNYIPDASVLMIEVQKTQEQPT